MTRRPKQAPPKMQSLEAKQRCMVSSNAKDTNHNLDTKQQQAYIVKIKNQEQNTMDRTYANEVSIREG